MKQSQLLHPMRRSDSKADDACASSEYFDSKGYTTQLSAGIYTQLPMGYRLFGNVKTILNRELENVGVGLHHFPALHPRSIWEKSGRLASFGNTMFSFQDKDGRDWCLGPTEEVLAADLAGRFIKSYRDMPLIISQTQAKYRNEARPRGGVLRTKEFTMQDAYSFDCDEDAARRSYDKIASAYRAALLEMRVPCVVQAQDDMGDIGGTASHEYHVIAEVGEDAVIDPVTREKRSSIEIAHTFMLGVIYSEAMDAYYIDSTGNRQLVFMCSFGMGIERTAAAYVEAMASRRSEFTWSWALAPFKVVILGDMCPEMSAAYNDLSTEGIDTLLDDRSDVRLGRKIKESADIGYPIRVVFGSKYRENGLIDIAIPVLKQTFTRDPSELAPFVREILPAIRAAEKAQMNFDILKVDIDSKKIFVEVQNVQQLTNSVCSTVDSCEDLLGNFGRSTQKLMGKRHLIADDYRVVPVLVNLESNKHSTAIEVDGFTCAVVGSVDEVIAI